MDEYHGRVVGLHRPILHHEPRHETWILSMVLLESEDTRVLDEFSDRATAIRMLALCEKWLASDELTQAFIANTEDAIIDSWQDYSLIDWDAEARAEAEALEALPIYGMF